MTEPVEAMSASELEYICESPAHEHGGFADEYVEAAKAERSARLREREAAKKTINGYLDILDGAPSDYSKGVRQASRGIKAAMDLARERKDTE